MKDQDWLRFFRIISTMKSGRKVSKADQEFFVGAYEQGDPAAYETIKARLDSGQPLTEGDYDLMFDEARKLATSPENKETVLAIAQKAEAGKIAQNVRFGLNIALAGTDIITSIQQIKRGDALTKAARRPARPPALTRDALLAEALNDASQPDNIQRALLPAQLGIQEGYQADLANARIASGGQAGAYGAYSQGAVSRRDRASLDLVPLADQLQRGNEARRDRLVGQHVAEGQAIDASRSRFYPEDLYQYNLERQSAAELGQVGRSNLRSSMYGLAKQLPTAVSDYATRSRYDDIYNRMIAAGYGEGNSTFARDVTSATEDNWSNIDDDMYRRRVEESIYE